MKERTILFFYIFPKFVGKQRKILEMTFESDKNVITIRDILERYYYLEWIKDEAFKLGLTISKNKTDLIDELLEEYQKRRIDAGEIIDHLVSTLRVAELRQILNDNNLIATGRKDELIDRIFDYLQFEPAIKYVKGVCSVCNVDSTHEMHFGNDWKATHSICMSCGHESDINPNHESNLSVDIEIEEDKNKLEKEPIERRTEKYDSIQFDVSTIVGGTIAVSVTMFSASLTKLSIVSSIGIGTFSGIVCAVTLIFTRPFWSEKLYSFLVKRDGKTKQ